jgi:hypothetical protein
LTPCEFRSFAGGRSGRKRRRRARARIINESLAKLAFGDRDPLNQKFEWSFDGTNWIAARTIVGVVKDTRELGGGQTVLPTVFDSATQNSPGASVLIRTADHNSTAGRETARFIHEQDPKRPVTDVAWLSSLASKRVAPSRLNAALFGGFAILALAIAAIGVGGVLAFSIRSARANLGSDGARRRPLGSGRAAEGPVAAVGLALGVVSARSRDSSRVSVRSRVGGHHAATGTALALVALGAAWVPARRAAQGRAERRASGSISASVGRRVGRGLSSRPTARLSCLAPFITRFLVCVRRVLAATRGRRHRTNAGAGGAAVNGRRLRERSGANRLGLQDPQWVRQHALGRNEFDSDGDKSTIASSST